MRERERCEGRVGKGKGELWVSDRLSGGGLGKLRAVTLAIVFRFKKGWERKCELTQGG